MPLARFLRDLVAEGTDDPDQLSPLTVEGKDTMPKPKPVSIAVNRLACFDCGEIVPLDEWPIQDIVCDLGQPHPMRHCPNCGKPQRSPPKKA
jgi:hypothetical protein